MVVARLARSHTCSWEFSRLLHFFNLLPGGHSSLEPRLPIPNRTVKRVCADDSVPFAHAKVGYRQTIFKRKSPISKEVGLFRFQRRAAAERPLKPAAAAPIPSTTTMRRGRASRPGAGA